MPTASDELRAEWRHGEEGGGDEAAIEHLERAGYKLTRTWEWERPEGMIPTERDASAVAYLIDEWDFGGFVSRPAATA